MSKTVVLPYDPTWEALEWAKANCKSYITNQRASGHNSTLMYREVNIEYFFANEKDATLFLLRWGT